MLRAVALVALFSAGVAGYVARRRFMRFVVEGESMLPAYQPGDQVVVDTKGYFSREVRAGDVVVAVDPRDPARRLIKRVVRVEGGDIWLEGDNPDASTDSRHFGPVSGLVGMVRWRYWRG